MSRYNIVVVGQNVFPWSESVTTSTLQVILLKHLT